MERIEIRDTVDAQDDGLAIDYELLAPVPQRRFSDPGEASGPVIAATGDQARAVAIALHAKAVAVVLHFMEPFGTGRYDLAGGRDAEFELGFGHGG